MALRIVKYIFRITLLSQSALFAVSLLRSVVVDPQHRAIKCVDGMHSKSYADQLKLLGIDSLQTRHCFFDLTEVYKVLNNLTFLGFDQLFACDLLQCTRDYNLKLKKFHCRLDCRKHFFVNREQSKQQSMQNKPITQIYILIWPTTIFFVPLICRVET